MMTLEELINHRDQIDFIKDTPDAHRLFSHQIPALEVASKMLSALIIQLDSQSISFTP